jgi:sulfofructose kinase
MQQREHSNQSIKLLSVGHVALDLIFHVAAFPSEPTKVAAKHFIQSVGGMSGNAAVAAARLGAQVAFAGPVGDDDFADLFAIHFAREGVDCTRMLRLSGTTSSVSSIIVDDSGERTIINRRSEALKQPPPFSASWLDHIDVVTADPRCPVWCAAALSAAREKKVISVFDGDIAPDEDLRRLVPLSDWAVFSEAGLEIFAPGGHSVEMALRTAIFSGAQVAAVTHGEKGVYWMRAGERLMHQPAHLIPKVIDTTGAGDVFHAALAIGLAQKKSDQEAVAFAVLAAGMKCQRPGGILGAPRLQEVLEVSNRQSSPSLHSLV